jgi:hypothetical protein
LHMDDYRDMRGGAADPVTKEGNPQPPHPALNETPSERSQWGADVRPEPTSAPSEVYPSAEGLKRERKGPLNRHTGRRPAKQSTPL